MVIPNRKWNENINISLIGQPLARTSTHKLLRNFIYDKLKFEIDKQSTLQGVHVDWINAAYLISGASQRLTELVSWKYVFMMQRFKCCLGISNQLQYLRTRITYFKSNIFNNWSNKHWTVKNESYCSSF